MQCKEDKYMARHPFEWCLLPVDSLVAYWVPPSKTSSLPIELMLQTVSCGTCGRRFADPAFGRDATQVGYDLEQVECTWMKRCWHWVHGDSTLYSEWMLNITWHSQNEAGSLKIIILVRAVFTNNTSVFPPICARSQHSTFTFFCNWSVS